MLPAKRKALRWNIVAVKWELISLGRWGAWCFPRIAMVQIGETFNAINALFEICAKSWGSMDFAGEAERRNDKTVVEEKWSLMHMVRSISTTVLKLWRTTCGRKSEQATLRLRAFHESGSVVIEVSDDGRGLDRQNSEKPVKKKSLGPMQLCQIRKCGLIFGELFPAKSVINVLVVALEWMS